MKRLLTVSVLLLFTLPAGAAAEKDETRRTRLQLTADWFRRMLKIGEVFPGSSREAFLGRP